MSCRNDAEPGTGGRPTICRTELFVSNSNCTENPIPMSWPSGQRGLTTFRPRTWPVCWEGGLPPTAVRSIRGGALTNDRPMAEQIQQRSSQHVALHRIDLGDYEHAMEQLPLDIRGLSARSDDEVVPGIETPYGEVGCERLHRASTARRPRAGHAPARNGYLSAAVTQWLEARTYVSNNWMDDNLGKGKA